MNPDYIAFCTDGKIFVTSDIDTALAIANVSKVVEISPVGHGSHQLVTYTGAGSPYTITVTAATLTAHASDGQVKQRK